MLLFALKILSIGVKKKKPEVTLLLIALKMQGKI